jgi:4-amino-4-deoxy-L-arabinose transferase-like glycosyltransferase
VFWTISFGFLVRAQTFRAPVFDHHNWRQADTAQIARNFLRERFNPFFPQVDQRGAQEHGYVETGFELYAFALACVARLAGFHPEIGRLFNCLLFVASALVVFRFLLLRYGRSAAVIGSFVYAFGMPLPLFLDRAIMNEPLLIFLSFVCLASAQAYVARRGWHAAATLIVASALVAMIKFPYLIIWGPVFGLLLEHDGRRAWKHWLFYAMATVDLVAAALWYSHAHRLGQMTGLSFGTLDKVFDPTLVFSVRFYVDILSRLGKDILGPAGVVGAAVGLTMAIRRRRWPELLGVLAFISYVILVARGNKAHDYYQVAVVPVALMPVTTGIREGIRALHPPALTYVTAVTLVLAAMLLSTFVRSVSFHSWYEYDLDRVQLCRELRTQLRPRELVAFLDYPSPDLLVCLDRHGWLFSAGAWSATDVLRIWQQGAAILVVPAPGLPATIPEPIRGNSALVARSGHLSAYRLATFPVGR